jgi:CheY-like chemotaxis protein
MDLVLAVEHAVEVARPQCARQQVQLTVDLPDEPLWIDGDLTRVVQVVSNLLHNACKFTPRERTVSVRARRDGALGEVRVRDEGIGIAADHLGRIFEMFLQVDEKIGRAHGGLGIGLSVVKSLVEMHGGTISAHSDGPGRGSEFVIRLPLANGAASTAGESALAAGDAPALRPQRFLVLDDNRDAAESLEAVLRLHGHEVVVANDGESALVGLEAHEPAIALLDLGLPGMDGYEVARRIRAGVRGRDTILVAITGWGQEEDRRRTREAGFDAHLTKPVEYPTLASLLADLLVRPAPSGT